LLLRLEHVGHHRNTLLVQPLQHPATVVRGSTSR
jgi:hypothetical protein